MLARQTIHYLAHSMGRKHTSRSFGYENIAIDKGNCSYIEFNSLEIEGRRIINSDKLLCPYLRVSPTKG
ncbi:hypothetical protein H5410_019447 [Solanum commersonii]|uniref:Uncharacterized protein n=1 Tax=Solanum commersonii TaxID=4109 RepID=A0A9J5ZB78_SOLCO|nr:hypothetical protein H5410_019447 [Solanum commersonii]